LADRIGNDISARSVVPAGGILALADRSGQRGENRALRSDRRNPDPDKVMPGDSAHRCRLCCRRSAPRAAHRSGSGM